MRKSAIAALALVATALPCAVQAQSLADLVSLRVEGGLGSMLSTHQRSMLGYTQIDGWAALRMGALLWGPVGVQVSGVGGFFPSDQGLGELLGLTASLRVEPVIPNTPVRILLDAGAGPGWTGRLLRPTFEAGIGIEISGHVPVAIGVSARYVRVFQVPSDPFPDDAQALFGVLHIALRMPPHRTQPVAPAPLASERERDHDPQGGSGDLDDDGVIDLLDQCPDVPMGRLRDPHRLGCPRPDSDRDGVPDNEDNCPVTPPGTHPDLHHPGCPDPDGDGDGMVDRLDVCPTDASGLFPDPERPGCPRPDRDHDTIPDALDHCPERLGMPERRPTHNGCPGLFAIVENIVRFMPAWAFAPGDAHIADVAQPALLALATGVRSLPPTHLFVRVFSNGSPTALSNARAQALVDWFRARHIDADLETAAPAAINPAEPDGTPVIRVAPAM